MGEWWRKRVPPFNGWISPYGGMFPLLCMYQAITAMPFDRQWYSWIPSLLISVFCAVWAGRKAAYWWHVKTIGVTWLLRLERATRRRAKAEDALSDEEDDVTTSNTRLDTLETACDVADCDVRAELDGVAEYRNAVAATYKREL